MRTKHFIAFALLISLGGCSRPQPPVMIIPDGWTEVKAGDQFSLYAPPGTIFQPRRGIDSFVGDFEGNRFHIDFDYGRYSNPLSEMRSDPAYHAEHFGVGSQLALFEVGPSRGEENCAATKTSAALYVHGIGPNSLMIFACMDDVDETPMIRSIFRTIRFVR